MYPNMSSKCLQLVLLPWIISLRPRKHESEPVNKDYISVHNELWNSFFFSIFLPPAFGNGHELHGEWHLQHLLLLFVTILYHLFLYLFYFKKQLSIVQELNCHKDLCALTCEALGVLQARLPFTWETRASLFRFWTFLWPFISLVVPRTRRGCPTAIICSIIPKRHPTHNNTKPSRQTKPVTKRHYFGTLTRGYGGYGGGTLGWCDTLSPRILSAHLEEATLRC